MMNFCRYAPWLIVLSLGCGATYGADAAPQKVVLPELQLTLPSAWERLPEAGTILTVRTAPESPTDDFLENIRILSYPVPSHASLDELLELQRQDGLPAFHEIGKGEVPGAPSRTVWLALKSKTPATPTNKLAGELTDALTKIDFMTLRGDRLYVLHCMTATEEYAKFRPLFETIAKSVIYPPVDATATPRGFSQRSPAEQGAVVGRLTFYALIAAVLFWIVRAAIRRRSAKAE